MDDLVLFVCVLARLKPGVDRLSHTPRPTRRPSIDETHPSFDYQPHPSYSTLHATPSRTQLINPSTGGTSTTLNGGGPDDSQTYLHRTLTDESMHSREPLNFTPRMESGGTPEMNSNPYASSAQGYAGSSIRPVKETDYGKVATGAGAGAGTTYPPGQYTSIPLNDGGMGEKQEMGSERGRKKGIAWGGADRWSRNGTKEGEFSVLGARILDGALMGEVDWGL